MFDSGSVTYKYVEDLLNPETMKIIGDRRCLLVEFQCNLWDAILTTNKPGRLP